MARNERYITVVELNSQQAMDRLKELEKKVKDLKRAKEEAVRNGQFFDEASLKKATKELNQWRAQIKGVQGILDNINDVTLEDLNKALRKLRVNSSRMLPGTEEWNEAQRGIMAIEERIKELKNSAREAKNESEELRENLANLSSVMNNIKGASLNELLSAQKYLETQLSDMKPGSTSYDTAIAQLKEVKNRIQEVKAEQQQIVHQIDRYDEEIKTSAKDMATVERETELVNNTLKNINSANIRDLEYSVKILNEQLRETPRHTEEYKKLEKQAKSLKTELEKARFATSGKQSWLNRTADFFNKIQGAAIAAIGAISGLTITIRKCTQAYADMDQEMENVRKYTGQTSEQVHDMNEEFKKMDTRTSREKLNQLAGDAGRLGIQGREGIMEFVDAADKINVALGDDLGENAVKNIGKLAMSFGTDKTMGLRGAMLATGSAINEVSQNSSASAGYLVEFTARAAGFAKQIGLTQAQLMGFGAVMDENMLKDEMAATAFGQLLVKMTTDLETFANITGMKVEQYKKLVTEDINGAVLAVAKSLKGRDMEEMGKIFDDMHLNGQRAIGVLATLGQKVDDVKERQKIATEAFSEGVSVMNEYNIQNATVQAQIDKAKKKFNDLAIDLGEKLLPVVRYTITSGAAIVKLLSALITFVAKYSSTILILGGTVTALIIIEEKEIIVKKLQVFWNEKVIATTKKLWALLLAHPYAALAVAVGFLIGLYLDLTKKTDGVSMAMRRINKNREESAKKMLDEKDKVELLIKASKNEKISLENRLKAIDKLEKKIPGYITQLDRETGKYKENKKALDDYLRSLEKKYELEGAKEMLADLGKEIAEATVNADKAKKAVEAASNAGNGYTYTTSWGAVGNTTSDLQQKTQSDLDRANSKLKEKLTEREQILKTYGLELQEEAAKAQEAEEEVVNPPYKPKGDTKKEETERKKRETAAAKELRERNNALKAQTEAEIAIVTQRYAKGEIDYRTFVSEIDRIQLEGFEKRMAIYEQESDEYKKILNDREQYALKSQEKQERMNLQQVEREHNRIVAELESRDWRDEGAYLEAMYQAELNYMMKKAELYRKGSEERAEINEEIEDMEYRHQLESQRRYNEMLMELQEQYLEMGNQRQMDLAMNGLDELHRQGLVSEEEYQKARIAIQAQYANAQTSSEKARKTGSDMLTVARNNAIKGAESTDTESPFLGTINMYRSTMEQLNVLYANDAQNYAAYQEAKRMATSMFLDQIAQDFQMAWNSINSVISAASSYFSAAQEYELNVTKDKYDKEIAAAGKNQKKVKALQEKQAKEEAAIKSKYNAKAVKIQIAQALASTALSAINAYSSAAQVPLVGHILAPIAAAAAVAAGMIQVAAIKKQAQAQEAGYYTGGYTGGKRYRKEAGVVHEGEFVANHQAVNNSAVRPMLDFIDKAQKNNTVGSLTAEDISRQLGQGGSAVIAPIVNVSTDNEELKEAVTAQREATEKLVEKLEEGIECYSVISGPHGQYQELKRYERLINKK